MRENNIFRYRKINGSKKEYFWDELENNNIYFAPAFELNDPMEMESNLSWEGDSIAWKNFIDNYFLSFFHTFQSFLIYGDTVELDIIIGRVPDDLPTKQWRQLYKECYSKIYEDRKIKEMPGFLEKRKKIGKGELAYHLHSMQVSIFKKLYEIFASRKLCPEMDFSLLPSEAMTLPDGNVEELLSLEATSPDSNIAEKQFEDFKTYNDVIKLNYLYNNNSTIGSKNDLFTINTFPESYIDKLVKTLLVPSYGIACFSYCNDNPVMWGHYADSHKGICLQFKPGVEENGSLFLQSEKSGKLPFRKVSYGNNFHKMNFFENIATLPLQNIKKHWFESNGQVSAIYDKYRDKNKWRKKNKEDFFKLAAYKYSDWDYEKECRIVNKYALSHASKEARVIPYDFNYLNGIIFGINTPDEHKLKIIKIIEDKCHKYKRSDFKFYQAYLTTYEGNMEIRQLKLSCFDSLRQ